MQRMKRSGRRGGDGWMDGREEEGKGRDAAAATSVDGWRRRRWRRPGC